MNLLWIQWMHVSASFQDKYIHIGVRSMGLRGLQPPRIFQIAIFGQNHLIFVQAMEKIFGQETSAPLNETRPVRLWYNLDKIWVVFCFLGWRHKKFILIKTCFQDQYIWSLCDLVIRSLSQIKIGFNTKFQRELHYFYLYFGLSNHECIIFLKKTKRILDFTASNCIAIVH